MHTLARTPRHSALSRHAHGTYVDAHRHGTREPTPLPLRRRYGAVYAFDKVTTEAGFYLHATAAPTVANINTAITTQNVAGYPYGVGGNWLQMRTPVPFIPTVVSVTGRLVNYQLQTITEILLLASNDSVRWTPILGPVTTGQINLVSLGQVNLTVPVQFAGTFFRLCILGAPAEYGGAYNNYNSVLELEFQGFVVGEPARASPPPPAAPLGFGTLPDPSFERVGAAMVAANLGRTGPLLGATTQAAASGWIFTAGAGVAREAINNLDVTSFAGQNTQAGIAFGVLRGCTKANPCLMQTTVTNLRPGAQYVVSFALAVPSNGQQGDVHVIGQGGCCAALPVPQPSQIALAAPPALPMLRPLAAPPACLHPTQVSFSTRR